jgi:hypothetical protein
MATLQITGEGDTIRGIIPCHAIPHLGVYACQEEIPFTSVLSAEVSTGTLQPLIGSFVALSLSGP